MTRVHSPKLVIPALVHDKHALTQLGVSNLRTIGQRQDNLAAEKQLGEKPPIVGGNLADATSHAELLDALDRQGIIRNGAELGIAPTDPLAYEDFVITAALTAATNSNASTSVWGSIRSITIAVTLGQWIVTVLAEASFTNSAAAINDYRLIDTTTSVVLDSGSPTTTTDRERYALTGGVQLAAGDTDTIDFQYKVNTTGTATARAPWLLVLMKRIL